jgi:hypothetical protein
MVPGLHRRPPQVLGAGVHGAHRRPWDNGRRAGGCRIGGCGSSWNPDGRYTTAVTRRGLRV